MEIPFWHDHTNSSPARNGWLVLSFEGDVRGRVRVSGSGYREEKVDGKTHYHELAPGELFIVSLPDGTAVYEILSISDHGGEPGDTYTAELAYLQHVAGFPIFGHLFDPARKQLNEWWGKRLWAQRKSSPEA